MSIIHHLHHHAARHYEKHYRSRYQERAHLVFLLDGLLVAAAFGLLGLGAYFNWFYHPLRDIFHLDVTTVGEVVGAQETAVRVTVENVGKQPLKNGRLVVYLPPNFLSEDGRVSPRLIEMGDVPPGVPVQYTFRGFPLGPAQDEKIVADFSAADAAGQADERLTTAELRWTRSLIRADFDLPSSAVPGQDLVFRLHVKNGSSLPFSDVSVIPEWPRGFQLMRSTPPFYRGLIKIGPMTPGDELELEFSGRLGPATDTLRFGADVAGYFEGQPYPMTSASSDVQPVTAGLKLDAVFPDPAPAYVTSGQEVPVLIRYQNTGDKPLSKLTLSLKPDPATIAAVRWDASPAIGDLAPGASGSRTAYVRLQDPISQYAVNPSLKIVPQADFALGEAGLGSVQIMGASVSAKIAGSAALHVAARYFTGEGDQIGRGPLPPKVGKTTHYWILANLSTGASQTQDGIVTFTLPPGVAWTGRAAVTSGEDLSLEGDRLIWRLGAIEAHAGTSFEAPSATFEVALTPSSGQVGTSPELLSGAAFTGVDAWTGIDLASSQPSLDTALPGDPRVAGRILVQP